MLEIVGAILIWFLLDWLLDLELRCREDDRELRASLESIRRSADKAS